MTEKTNKIDVFEKVNNYMLAEMEKGIIPWERTWFSEPTYNIVSGKPYSFLNKLMLGRSGAWATFKQWKQLGGSVKNGEKASAVCFWSFVNKEVDDETNSGEKTKISIPILKYFNVFHFNQIQWKDEVIPEKVQKKMAAHTNGIRVSEVEADDYAECIIDNYKATTHLEIEEDGDPSYSPSDDKVYCYGREHFKNSSEYYSALFHELGHSTGHKDRLNRDLTGRFGSKKYAREELIAEITASYMTTMLNLKTDKSARNNVAYCQSWSRKLADDKRAFVVAAGKAEKAVDCILTGKSIEEFARA